MVKRNGGVMPDGGQIKKKRFKLKVGTKTEVDPALVDHYRSVRQADKKRELFQQMKAQKVDAKRARRTERKQTRKILKDRAPAKLIPKTKERLRRADDTIVDTTNDEDAEIKQDEADDEFAQFFSTKRNPKIMITTCRKPSFRTRQFVHEAKWLFPNATARPRKDYDIKEIVQFCKNRNFTDLIIVGERLKQPYELIISHLPEGPTATFRISNFFMAKELENTAERTEHYPELIMKNFDTRLGRRIARFFEALFPATRDYEGRAVATFHNQRDYIFLRVHRYVFDSLKAVRIQEMGPRMTLRLMAIQQGTFDTKFGEYEWYRKKEHDADKLQWYL
jgi:ribosome production factor 1